MIADEYPHLEQCNRVVAIGGGHGLGRVMSSLAFLGRRLTGIVATTDNGGSTGRLRASRGGIAWGDLRNCLTQIASLRPSRVNDLFEYRFPPGQDDLAGHNLGNLILHALDDLNAKPVETLNMLRYFLRIRPFLFPMSDQPCNLVAKANGRIFHGETAVDQTDTLPEDIYLEPRVTACPEAVQHIMNADLILVGPGSFLTSILPPMLVPEIKEALQKTSAKSILLANTIDEDVQTGSISLMEKLTWGESILNAAPDAIIYPSNRKKIDTGKVFLFQTDLVSKDNERLHDPNKLRFAIEETFRTISDAP